MNKILAKMKIVSGLAREFGVRAAYVAQIEFNLTSTSKKEAYFLRKHDFITDLLQAKLQSVIELIQAGGLRVLNPLLELKRDWCGCSGGRVKTPCPI